LKQITQLKIIFYVNVHQLYTLNREWQVE